MRVPSRWLFTLGAGMLLGACATAGDSVRRDPNQISLEEIQAAQGQVGDVLHLVQTLRPRWLVSRGSRSLGHLPTNILVYQDGVRLGAAELLRDVPLQGIQELRYLDSAQAGLLPGLGSQHVEGVIMIITRP